MSDGENLRRTALYDLHLRAGARMVDFGGWDMPVQYAAGIVAEHRKVRESAGVFDVSHMGRLFLSGRDAGEFLQLMATNDVLSLPPGQALYTLVCTRDGGVRDDMLISRVGDDEYLVVPNAANREKIVGWIGELLAHFREGAADVALADRTADTVMVAVQGSRAQEILQPYVEIDLDGVRFFRLGRTRVMSANGIVSRTGYTGEDGFEVILPNDAGIALWSRFMEASGSGTLALAGLGARDTLRLEAGLPLYGHELSEEINPFEAGLGRFVRDGESDFVGREALVRIAKAGSARKLVGLEIADGAIARQGTEVKSGGADVGLVSSGTFSPTLERSIAMAFIASEVANSQPPTSVIVRGNPHPSQVVDLPFFHRRKRK